MKNILSKNKSQAFTLIELMIALAIAGILIAYALPAYNRFAQRQALSNETNNLIGDLKFARSLAINNSSAVIVSSTSGDANWENGWSITLTLANGNLQNVRIKQAIAGQITITETGGFSSIVYGSFGEVAVTSQPINLIIQTPTYANYITLGVFQSGMTTSSRRL